MFQANGPVHFGKLSVNRARPTLLPANSLQCLKKTFCLARSVLTSPAHFTSDTGRPAGSAQTSSCTKCCGKVITDLAQTSCSSQVLLQVPLIPHVGTVGSMEWCVFWNTSWRARWGQPPSRRHRLRTAAAVCIMDEVETWRSSPWPHEIRRRGLRPPPLRGGSSRQLSPLGLFHNL